MLVATKGKVKQADRETLANGVSNGRCYEFKAKMHKQVQRQRRRKRARLYDESVATKGQRQIANQEIGVRKRRCHGLLKIDAVAVDAGLLRIEHEEIVCRRDGDGRGGAAVFAELA